MSKATTAESGGSYFLHAWHRASQGIPVLHQFVSQVRHHRMQGFCRGGHAQSSLPAPQWVKSLSSILDDSCMTLDFCHGASTFVRQNTCSSGMKQCLEPPPFICIHYACSCCASCASCKAFSKNFEQPQDFRSCRSCPLRCSPNLAHGRMAWFCHFVRGLVWTAQTALACPTDDVHPCILICAILAAGGLWVLSP